MPETALKLQGDIITFIKKIFPPQCHSLVWLTGGGVRDILLQKAPRDIDLVAALRPGLLTSLGFRPVSARTTPDIWFLYDKEWGIIEATSIENAGQLEADLSRRDFTINAMAMTLEGVLIDPLHGASDLQERALRTCSPDSFDCDPIRIFRAFRFAAEGWQLAPEAGKLITRQGWDNLLKAIPVERFSREMEKALGAPFPGRYFQQMLTFSVGKGWLPELFSMAQIPAGPVSFHPEGDLLSHSLQVLERVSHVTDSPLARFCAFFHDIGKLGTSPLLHPKHHGHEESGFRSAQLLTKRLALSKKYGRALSWVSRLHGNLGRFDSLRDGTRITIAEQAIKAGIAELLPIVVAADRQEHFCSEEWLRALRIAAMTTAELEINNRQLASIPPEQRAAFILQRRVELLRRIPLQGVTP